jgi:hypothetical protein
VFQNTYPFTASFFTNFDNVGVDFDGRILK